MHCSNPNCYDDECDGGCRKPRELGRKKGQEMDWPWYRYEGNFNSEEGKDLVEDDPRNTCF